MEITLHALVKSVRQGYHVRALDEVTAHNRSTQEPMTCLAVLAVGSLEDVDRAAKSIVPQRDRRR